MTLPPRQPTETNLRRVGVGVRLYEQEGIVSSIISQSKQTNPVAAYNDTCISVEADGGCMPSPSHIFDGHKPYQTF